METGPWIAVAAVALGLIGAFLLRTAWPAPAVIAVLAASGAGLAWGALQALQATPVETAGLIPVMAFLVPFHVRIVLGPLGRRRG